ncbi:MAG TPA: hypothetical protein VNE67_17910 [Acetobacteraceae bacterium]|nr:hypothetical protein [Acetobacteraceae bacterium]
MDGVNNLAGGDGPPHDPSMEARVAVLEEIASATKQGMAGLRQDIGDLRNETSGRDEGLRQEIHELRNETRGRDEGLRQEIHELRNETGRRDEGLRQEIHELRNVQERDFRIMFGALITATIGLAALMAKGFHWF